MLDVPVALLAERQRLGHDLFHVHLSYETGVFDPKASGHSNYRTPDLVVFDDAARSERGVEGRARLVVEICSPGDESLQKLAYYESVGVSEVILIDRDTKSVRHWLATDQQLVETPANDDGWHHLQAVPARLRTVGTALELDVGGAITVI